MMLWSMDYEKVPLDERQLEARQFLIENERIPPEYDIFLFNATAETSINIRPDEKYNFKWDFFIANDPNEASTTQARGRYRGDLETFYLFDRNGAVRVPSEYLNRNLSNKEMVQLRDKLRLKKDKKGHPLPVDDMVIQLRNCGYDCKVFDLNRKKTFKIVEL